MILYRSISDAAISKRTKQFPSTTPMVKDDPMELMPPLGEGTATTAFEESGDSRMYVIKKMDTRDEADHKV